MRVLLITLCGVFAFGQQNPVTPKKVLTPGQQAFQQQVRQVDAERQSLRAAAKAAFDSEMAREKTEDCPPGSTADYNQCYSRVVDVTDQNLKNYEGAVRSLLGLRYPELVSNLSAVPATEKNVAAFDNFEQIWHSYLDAVSTAAFRQFDGGTGGPGFGMETHVRIVRSHLRELDTLYGLVLRH